MSLLPRLGSNAALETIKGGPRNLVSAELTCPSLISETVRRLMFECPTMTADEAEQRDRQFVLKYRSMSEPQPARGLTESP